MSLAAEQRTSQPEIRINPVRDRSTWEQMRQEVIGNPGLFHGNIAKRELHWFDAGLQAWINWDDRAGKWTAYSASTDEHTSSSPSSSRARALDLARVHRGAVEVGPDDLMNGLVRMSNVAIDLGLFDRGGHEREGGRVGVAGLGGDGVEGRRQSGR